MFLDGGGQRNERRLPWIAAALVLLLVGLPGIVGLLRVERIPHTTEDDLSAGRTGRDWSRRAVIRDPILYLLLAGILAPPFIGTSIFFHQGYLIALRGYDPLVFAGAFPVLAATTVAFGLVCGHLIDRFSALRLLPFFLLPLALASAAVGFLTPEWGIYLFMFLLGISSGFTHTLLGALWPEVYGQANLGGIRGDHHRGDGPGDRARAGHHRSVDRCGCGAAHTDAVDGRLVPRRFARTDGGFAHCDDARDRIETLRLAAETGG